MIKLSKEDMQKNILDKINPDKKLSYSKKLEEIELKFGSGEFIGILCDYRIAGYLLHLAKLAKTYRIVEPFFIGKGHSVYFVKN